MSSFDDESVSMLRESADDFLARSHDSKRMKGEIGQHRLIDRSIWGEIANYRVQSRACGKLRRYYWGCASGEYFDGYTLASDEGQTGDNLSRST